MSINVTCVTRREKPVALDSYFRFIRIGDSDLRLVEAAVGLNATLK